MRRGLMAVAAVVLVLGCGDPETTDERGYTKAPLENPSVLIEGEEPDAMRAHGTPDLPRAVVLEDSAAAQP